MSYAKAMARHLALEAVMRDFPAVVTLLRYAPPGDLEKLMKLLSKPTGKQEDLVVAIDAALEAGPIQVRELTWGSETRDLHMPILGEYSTPKPAYDNTVICYEGRPVGSRRRIGEADLRPLFRAWACDVAERVVRDLNPQDKRLIETIDIARQNGGSSEVSVEVMERARVFAFQRPLSDPIIAARTIALDSILPDAWDAAWYVAGCAAGWANRDMTELLDHVGQASPKHLSAGLRLVMEAQWTQLAASLEERALAVIQGIQPRKGPKRARV